MRDLRDNIAVVQLLSYFWLFGLHGMQQHFPGLYYLLDFAQTHAHWVNAAIQPSHPLSPPSPSAFNLPQHQGLFWWVSSLHNIAKLLQLQHQSFQWIFRVDLLRIDWFDLCAAQWTIKSLLQDHSLKASVLQCSAFLMVHLYVTTGKTTALTITLLPKSCFCFTICYPGLSWLFSQGASILTSWQQALSAVFLEPPKGKICHYLHFPLFYLPWNDGTWCHDLSLLNVDF